MKEEVESYKKQGREQTGKKGDVRVAPEGGRLAKYFDIEDKTAFPHSQLLISITPSSLKKIDWHCYFGFILAKEFSIYEPSTLL